MEGSSNLELCDRASLVLVLATLEDLLGHLEHEDPLGHLEHEDLLGHLEHEDRLGHLEHEDLEDRYKWNTRTRGAKLAFEGG